MSTDKPLVPAALTERNLLFEDPHYIDQRIARIRWPLALAATDSSNGDYLRVQQQVETAFELLSKLRDELRELVAHRKLGDAP